ncbi:hypothetical protein F0562_011826 [Nyssa sinensis]|uniref:Ubiquinone biosynthesis protein COQ4 homolog, mitochondrial n=1 Tax=Nyssa sinensis TaxID=561372 RepID=A0A5J4ZSX4_9ASTE|nr:hypothetical protein F0562_011826 [Nyssa sinensis]
MIEGPCIRLNGWQQAAVALGSAVGALLDPRRTDLIAALGETTGKPAFERVLERMTKSPEGRAILLERPHVIFEKVGRAWDLPANTFGGAYATFMGSRNFFPDDRPPVRFMDTEELAYVAMQAREVHNLWHTLFGLPTNLIGKSAPKAPAFGNGAFHWIISKDVHDLSNNDILSLDMSNEEFRTITFPDDIKSPHFELLRGYNIVEVLGSGSRLSLIVLDCQTDVLQSMQIWQVRENKVGLSFCYRCISDIRMLGSIYDLFSDIRMLNQDTFLLAYDDTHREHLLLYFPHGKQHVKLDILGLPKRFLFICFEPSLVSPRAAALSLV